MAAPNPPMPAPGSRGRGALLLADISGYTGFLQGVADAHTVLVVEADEPPAAYALMSSLLDQIVAALEPRFWLAKFEGDAVFAVADDAAALHGEAALACLRACYARFIERLGRASDMWTCRCNSCSRVGTLGLKFVLHHGDFVVQRITGREELLGPEVNVAHRLLKNHVQEQIGPRPYALITDAALDALGIPADGMRATTEVYEHMPPIGAHILELD